MKIFADLHLHSKYSRATSKNLDISALEKWGKVKGLNLLGTGDFTHPKWSEELKKDLIDDGTGIYKTKGGSNFIMQTEVSLIYSDLGKGRRVHNVILAPDMEIASQITDYFKSKGRVDYDGRPIFKIPCYEMTEKLMEISKEIEIIPAHVWTPWFGLFGSMSGFDKIEDAFKEQTKNIHALETGLSSDPAMNWRLSALDRFALISTSDSHSFWPWRIGREATIFDLKELTYKNLINALRTKEGILGTIEVDPGYGKYHIDGHRLCKVALQPEQSKKLHNLCPVCGKPLTIGVLNRVEQLADRAEGFRPKGAKDFYKLMPLTEIIAKLIGSPVASKKTWAIYNNLIEAFGSEFNVLIEATGTELLKVVEPKIVEMILKNRQGNIEIQPGYDGEYGIPIFSEEDRQQLVTEVKQRQMGIGDFTRPF